MTLFSLQRPKSGKKEELRGVVRKEKTTVLDDVCRDRGGWFGQARSRLALRTTSHSTYLSPSGLRAVRPSRPYPFLLASSPVPPPVERLGQPTHLSRGQSTVGRDIPTRGFKSWVLGVPFPLVFPLLGANKPGLGVPFPTQSRQFPPVCPAVCLSGWLGSRLAFAL